MKYQITENDFTPEIQEEIFTIFREHAVSMTGMDGFTKNPKMFEVKDGANLAGRIVFSIFWGQVHIKYLVIDEKYRGQGLGKLLMEKVFEYARKQNCDFIFLETMTFQAIEFYTKLGFVVELQRDGYKGGVGFCYMKKNL